MRGTLKPYGRGWDDPADDDLIPEGPMRRGDMVELEWPFSDLTDSKLRPAVVV